jgi:predicted amidohydrolase
VVTVRIALANLRVPATPDESVHLATSAVADAAGRGAAIVCFPECYVPGYRWPNVPGPAPDGAFLARAWVTVAEAAGAAHIAVVLGTERITDRGLLISALVVNADGSIAGWQDKVQIDPSEEVTYAAAGSERRIFTAGPLTFGVAICHEGWRYPETVRWAARRGAQVVFHPHAHVAVPGSYRPTTFADPANTFHEKAMLCRAAESTIYFASVNAASEGSGTTSAVIRPDGTVQCWQPYGQEGLLVADLDPTQATGLLASRCRTTP